MYWIYFILFTLINASSNSLRGSYIQERENDMIDKKEIIKNYVYTYGIPIYIDILMKMMNEKIYYYSFIEFGCIPLEEDMKNTEIIISKNNQIKITKQSIFQENEIDYTFKVYSCYSHFMTLNIFKKERNLSRNKNDYIPNNDKCNHFKYYYFEDLEYYNIDKKDVQKKMNKFLLKIFDDTFLTHSYENCCRVYTLNW